MKADVRYMAKADDMCLAPQSKIVKSEREFTVNGAING